MSHQETNPEGVHALIEDGEHAVVDVRTVEEFDEGHIPGAYNIPYAFRSAFGMEPNPAFAASLGKHFAKDAKLVFV